MFRLQYILLSLALFSYSTLSLKANCTNPSYPKSALIDTITPRSEQIAPHNCCPPSSHSSVPEDSTEVHEITLFLMPTMYPLDWSSPSSLYKSMLSVYLKTIGLKDNYLLGHLVVRLTTPFLDQPLYTAQSSSGGQERIDMVLRERVGYGILGASLQGRIEPPEEIQHKIDVYRKRNKLGFITYRVNRKAMERMLTFYDKYQHRFSEEYAPSDFYGGAFWPRYHYEGAGCSTFGFAMLDVAGLIPEEAEKWLIDVKIPMNIIGGHFNNNKKIRNRTIRRTKQWFEGEGMKNVDYADYFVWDPAIMFDWVKAQHENSDDGYQLVDEQGSPGVYKDARNITVDPYEPIFMQRPDTNLFILDYYERINLHKK